MDMLLIPDIIGLTIMANVTMSGGEELKKFIKQLQEQMGHTTLEVGFFDSKQATIAAKNEFGGLYEVSEEYKERALKKGIHVGDYINIPPRPFMHDTVRKRSKNWGITLCKAMRVTNFDVPKAMRLLGQQMEGDVKDVITEGDFTTNSPRTAEIKGFNKPLVDTGSMLTSVTYEVHTS